jgi:hypothetical protein
MKQIHKEYSQAFILEPTKLTRLVDKIHERLGEHQPTTKRALFEVFIAGNRREEMDSLDAVLALENSRKQKIQRLIITCCAGKKVATRLEHEIHVDFGGKKPGGNNRVAVSIHSEAAGWAASTLSELEEQLERTWLRYLQPFLALIVLLVLVLLVFMTQLVAFPTDTNQILRGMWLHEADMDRVDEILKQNRTITDEEVRELVTMQLRNVRQDLRPPKLLGKRWTRQALLLGIPLVVVVVCAFLLVSTCYPSAVFLWGDEVERYANTLFWRKALWGVIVSVTFLGVLPELFAAGVASLLPE